MFAYTAMAVVIAYFVKGMCGFANTLVFSSIMSFTENNLNISPLELVVSCPSNLVFIWKERRNIHTKKWLPVTLIMLLGAVPGIWFLKNGSPAVIKVLFGCTIAGLAIEMLLRELHSKVSKPNKLVQWGICILAGAMSGMFGIGALLAAYFSRTAENASEFKGNLCMVFLMDDILRFALYISMGILNAEVALKALKLLPFMVLGLVLGMLASGKIPEKRVKMIVIIMLLISGISLILMNI